MASVIATTAQLTSDALQTESDADGFTFKITAERSYLAERKLEDLNLLYVDVVHQANEQELTQETRGTLRYIVSVGVGIRKRFTRPEQEGGLPSRDDTDAFMAQAEEIAEFLLATRLSNTARGMSATFETIAPDNYLREESMFYAKVVVKFQYSKAV